MTNQERREQFRQLAKEQEANIIDLVLRGGCWKCDGDVEVTKLSKGLYVGLCNKCNASTSKASAKKVKQFAHDLKDYYERLKA